MYGQVPSKCRDIDVSYSAKQAKRKLPLQVFSIGVYCGVIFLWVDGVNCELFWTCNTLVTDSYIYIYKCGGFGVARGARGCYRLHAHTWAALIIVSVI